MPILRLFLDLCLLKKGPQDCPALPLLLSLAIAVNLVANFLLSLSNSDLATAVGQTVLGAVFLAGFLWGALYFTGKLARGVQTGTAAFGCDTLISAVAGLLLLLGEAVPPIKEPVMMVLFLLLLWQIAVLGNILRHALDLPLAAGVGLSLAYFMVSFRILTTLFPMAE